MGFFVEEPYTAMNKFNSTVLATLLLVYSPLGIGQGQALIEPEMEVVDLVNLEPRSPREGLHMRSDGLATIRIGRLNIEAGASTPSHNHANEQMVLVLEGRIKAFSGDKEFVLGPGEMFKVPAYVHHYYTALEDSLTIEVFGPG